MSSMWRPRTVRPRKQEAEPLRSAMRDVQISIENYYRQTTGFIEDAEHFTTPVRATVVFIQKVNEVLAKDFGQQGRYKRVFAARLARHDRGAETIEALRYVRNVGQHLIHPVRPESAQVVGSNMGLGLRTSAVWVDIPRSVHRSLRPGTQKLRSLYDAHLVGNNVLDTFLDAARFFWEVCPECVHRAPGGEWTGFPLRHQAGVASRLHPEEPSWDGRDKRSLMRAQRWMNNRRPGGDRRLICGQLTTEDGAVIFGCTFRGRATYQGFAETADQINRDIALGYPYHIVDPSDHLTMKNDMSDYGGAFTEFFVSVAPLDSWIGEPIVTAPTKDDFIVFQAPEFWQRVISLSLTSPLDRRNQRLAAWFPIH